MSNNVFAGLTDENRVFISGLYRHFNLKEINLPKTETQKIASVGAGLHTYVIVMEDNSFYTNTRLPNFETNLYYGKEKLFKYVSKEKGNNGPLRITGKYEALVGSAYS